MTPAVETMNPRVVRNHFQQWEGKRVTVGLVNDHYLCGTWTAVDQHRASFRVGGNEMSFPLVEIANVAEAPALQPDFFK